MPCLKGGRAWIWNPGMYDSRALVTQPLYYFACDWGMIRGWDSGRRSPQFPSSSLGKVREGFLEVKVLLLFLPYNTQMQLSRDSQLERLGWLGHPRFCSFQVGHSNPSEVSVLRLPAFLTPGLSWGSRPLVIESRWMMKLQGAQVMAKTLPRTCQDPPPHSEPSVILTEALTCSTDAFSSSLRKIWMVLNGNSGDGRSRFMITS